MATNNIILILLGCFNFEILTISLRSGGFNKYFDALIYTVLRKSAMCSHVHLVLKTSDYSQCSLYKVNLCKQLDTGPL